MFPEIREADSSCIRSLSGPYSLSGVRLEGEKLVRLVFIDEAGLSHPQQEPFVVVIGVLVNGDSALNAVENQLQRIRGRHPQLGNDFVFHAFELFGGSGKTFGDRSAWPLDKRLAIADEILSIPKKFALPLALGFVKRAEFAKTFAANEFGTKDETVAAHVLAFAECSVFVEQWMRLNASNENCVLVVENNDRARSLIRDIHQFHQSDPTRELLKDLGKGFFPFRKIRQDPLFQEKRPSSALIVADFCAYVSKKFSWETKDTAFDLICFGNWPLDVCNRPCYISPRNGRWLWPSG